MRLARLVVGCAVIAAFSLTAKTAFAYPQFQFSTDTVRCGDCHFSPTGGGLINAYGRSEAGDTISRGGDGSFLHGVWEPPSWFQLGADLRYAGLFKTNDEDRRFLHFPMQGDTYLRFAWKSLSAYLSLGPRAQARTPRQSALRRMVSREHYLMWQPKSSGVYARIGRFLAPFGLRLADHTVYTRKFLGLHVLEETYNASAGYFGNGWEAHLTAFMPADRFTSAGPREKGMAALYEHRLLDDTAAVGAQMRLGFGDDSDRAAAGFVAKYYFEPAKILVLGELNAVHQRFSAASSPSRVQLASYLGASYWPTTGVMISGAFERFDEDLSVAATFRDAFRAEVQFFPWAHWELHFLTKLEVQGEYEDANLLTLLMAHYYL